jgi:hypothetical protein
MFDQAVVNGEVTDEVAPEEMARILTALVMDSIAAWTEGSAKLHESISRRAGILLRGLAPC